MGHDPSPQATAGIVASAIDHLRGLGLHPAMWSEYLVDGALAQSGWTLWGPVLPTPTRGSGVPITPEARPTGYANLLRASAYGEYETSREQTTLNDPTYTTPRDYHQLQVEQSSSASGVDDMERFPQDYDAGGAANSVAYQGAVFSPNANLSTFHRFEELTQLLDRAFPQMQVYFNVGMANTPSFPTGTLAFNRVYAVEVRRPADQSRHARVVVNRAIASGRERFVSSDVYGPALPTNGFLFQHFPKFVFDPTHPTVVALCLAHVMDFVLRHDRAAGYFLRGENLVVFNAETSPNLPIRNFAPHVLAGFREFMRYELNGDVGALQARWRLSTTFDQFDVRGREWNAEVARDFRLFHKRLMRELVDWHYTAAKLARPGGWYAGLSFGVAGLERSAIDTDFASSGNYHDEESLYFRVTKNALARMADAARLVGKPVAFGLSAPPFTPEYPLAGPANWAWFRRCFRRYRREHLDLYFREILTASISHVSYLMSYFHGVRGLPSSAQAANDGIARMASLRPRSLDFMGPYQRVAIQADTLDELDVPANAGVEPSAYLAFVLNERLREQHVPSALFSDPSLFLRTFPRWQLRRDLTFVCFPRQPYAAAVLYGEALSVSAPGAMVLVVDLTTAARVTQEIVNGGGSLGPPVTLTLSGSPIDTAQLAQVTIRSSRGPARVYLLAFRNIRVSEVPDAYLRACAALLVQEAGRLAPNLVVRPAAPRSIAGAPLYTNSVTDGVNSFVAVSWAAQGTSPPQPLTVDVDAGWAGRFDPRVISGFQVSRAFGDPSTIGPEETRFFFVEATFTSAVRGAVPSGFPVVATAFRAVLDQLQSEGFEVEPARRLLSKATQVAATYPERALTGLAQLSRMVFVRAVRNGRSLDVYAKTAWGNGWPAGTAVANGEVQVVLALNAHEVQVPVAVLNGRAQVQIADPRRPRWNFFFPPPTPSYRFYTPSYAEVSAVVEVHVTDQETGAHGFARV